MAAAKASASKTNPAAPSASWKRNPNTYPITIAPASPAPARTRFADIRAAIGSQGRTGMDRSRVPMPLKLSRAARSPADMPVKNMACNTITGSRYWA